jgi:hypothetical protein
VITSLSWLGYTCTECTYAELADKEANKITAQDNGDDNDVYLEYYSGKMVSRGSNCASLFPEKQSEFVERYTRYNHYRMSLNWTWEKSSWKKSSFRKKKKKKCQIKIKVYWMSMKYVQKKIYQINKISMHRHSINIQYYQN